MKWVLPVGRTRWAIVAGYAGLFSILLVPAPAALAAGVYALTDLRKHPGAYGRGRAWFAVAMGSLGTAGLVITTITFR
jgi:hypothetical protein